MIRRGIRWNISTTRTSGVEDSCKGLHEGASTGGTVFITIGKNGKIPKDLVELVCEEG
jgi:hypothetical protein